MLTLANDELSITLLDPIQDAARLGSRFCSGGYIYALTDNKLGNLMSGPAFPAPKPPIFDGQGMPEVFEIALGQDTVKLGEDVCVIGNGLVRRVSDVKPFTVRYNLETRVRTPWAIAQHKDRIIFTTEQSFKDYKLRLIREIQLNHRTITSKTTITNLGLPEIPVRWFAHPFFPLTKNQQYCKFDLEYALPANIAFQVIDDWITNKPDYDLNIGLNQPLDMALGYPCCVTQKHPMLGEVHTECQFPLALMTIWGNAHTFSFEPYFHTVLRSNDTSQWQMVYHF